MAQRRNGTAQFFYIDAATLIALHAAMKQHGTNKTAVWCIAMQFYAASLTELSPAARARIWKKVQEQKS